MITLALQIVLMFSLGVVFPAQELPHGAVADPLTGWKTKSAIDDLVARLRAGEIKGEQALFSKENGPYRVYTSFIDNRKAIADVHEKDDEIFVVVSGSAQSTLGGTVAAVTRRSPYEVRGTQIVGGETRQVGVGDVISVPRGTAHQMDATGGHVLYIVIKVIREPNP